MYRPNIYIYIYHCNTFVESVYLIYITAEPATQALNEIDTVCFDFVLPVCCVCSHGKHNNRMSAKSPLNGSALGNHVTRSADFCPCPLLSSTFSSTASSRAGCMSEVIFSDAHLHTLS